MFGRKTFIFLLVFLLGVSACDVVPSPESTPTSIPSPTQQDATRVAIIRTSTPQPTSTSSVTPTSSLVPPTQRPTQRASLTASATSSRTATYTLTHTPRPTRTSTPSHTHTLTFSPTLRNTETPSRTPTWTLFPTSTALPTRAPSDIPTFTPRPSNTASATPTHTASPSTNVSTDTILTLTTTPAEPQVIVQATRPSSTPVPFTTPRPTINRAINPLPTAEAGNVNLNESDDLISETPLPFSSPTPDIIFLPTADRGPVIQPTNTPFGFNSGNITVGTNTSILFASGNQYVNSTGTPIVAGASAFDFGASPNQVAAYYPSEGWFYVNGVRLETSPASEFGLGNKRITQIDWAPNNAIVAFVVDGEDPANAFDYGVWIYDVGSGRARQIFRNEPNYRRALDIQWSPNNGALLITIRSESPPGIVHTILALDHDPNDRSYIVHTYSYATWAPNSGSVIVSGRNTDGSIVLGRILLPNQNYIPINATAPDVVFTNAAIETIGGQIYFLGSPNESGPHRLYRINAEGGEAAIISTTSVSGELVDAEWNNERNALLAVFNMAANRRAYVFNISGGVTDVTPPSGIVGDVRWQ